MAYDLPFAMATTGAPLNLCPFLPFAEGPLDYRSLAQHREGPRGGEFYLAALTYAQQLWLRELPARAILALVRALYADEPPEAEQLAAWPPPYAALRWFLRHAPTTGPFLGNPRLSFEHQATRIRALPHDPRPWRAWGCWAIVRETRPDLPGEPGLDEPYPTLAEIAAGLHATGWPGEAEIWESAVQS